MVGELFQLSVLKFGEQALFYYLAIQFTLKVFLGGFIVIIGCMELYRVIKRDEPIKELGIKLMG